MKEFKFSGDFASGADISWLPMMELTGFRFKDKDGNIRDCLDILKSYGIDAIRLRSWVNPSSHPHRGHCSAQETLEFAKRLQRYGFDVMIDLHYGDSWCDPGQQVKPKAWQDLPFEKLLEAVYSYTLETISTFVSNGFTPKWVQLGNETNPGMLLPDGSTDDFSKLTRIYNAAHKAVKEASPETATIIHLAEGNNTDFLVNYFDKLRENGCTYDMIGLSYYPYWFKKPNSEIIGDLERSFETLSSKFDKDVILVEIGGVDEEEDESYELLISAIEKCHNQKRCKGIFYWEPQGAKAWSNYNLSAWREDGTPTHAMDAYLSIKKKS
ncbi:MAG: glycosyl hydrolase 53 family protein [Clostridiales bacterium]|jgi:arabinogalactan endo-1,4-beta-galactosidase|nr:glycosyl hydrolase 53 family protein [Clostridiales bacterium]